MPIFQTKVWTPTGVLGVQTYDKGLFVNGTCFYILLNLTMSLENSIVATAGDGWGHQDSLRERYENVYGDFYS
jgi:hypothetical protein